MGAEERRHSPTRPQSQGPWPQPGPGPRFRRWSCCASRRTESRWCSQPDLPLCHLCLVRRCHALLCAPNRDSATCPARVCGRARVCMSACVCVCARARARACVWRGFRRPPTRRDGRWASAMHRLRRPHALRPRHVRHHTRGMRPTPRVAAVTAPQRLNLASESGWAHRAAVWQVY